MKNVIYIIADQMRWDVLGCNGADYIQTPNFDRLAESSVNFSCAYSGNPCCVPARGIMATGRYSHKCMDPAGLNFNSGRIMPENVHIADLLQKHGYSTYGIGKAHCLPYKTNPGFDVFEIAEEGRLEMTRQNNLDKGNQYEHREDYFEYLEKVGYAGMQRAHCIGNNDPRAGEAALPDEHYVDTWATTRSLELLEKHLDSESDKPFYLQLGFVKPHAPYDPPAPYSKMYDPREIPTPWGGAADQEGRNPAMPTFQKNYMIERMDDMAIQYSRAHYFGLITYLDAQVGRVLDFVDSHGIADETIIVFTADHGDNIGDHGLFFKTFFTEGSAHIPLLVSLPGTTTGKECIQPVGQEDIMPTICDNLGITIPNEIDGASLLPLITQPEAKHAKPFAVSQYGTDDHMSIMIREQRYKYCYVRYNATEELYDLAEDPHEMVNLVTDAKYADELLRLRTTTNQWCIDNQHSPILMENGTIGSVEYILEDNLRAPDKTMGVRKW